jgi:large subunit ribosomal protein L1
MAKRKTVTIDDSIETPEKANEPKKGFSISRPKEEPKEEKKFSISRPQEEITSDVADTADKAEAAPVKEVKKEAKKAESGKKRGKKYLEKIESVDRTRNYPLTEAITLAQTGSYTKFAGSVEAHINTSTKGIRGLVSMPFAAGKKLTILAFGDGAADSGADLVGDDAALEQILKSKINFDVLVTTPAWMPKLARAAKVLGPRGLMPNPKNGTISENLSKTITEIQSGKMEYRTEPNGTVIHLAVGKVEQDPSEIAANIKALYNLVGKSRIKKITLAPTMGPGVKVDLGSI